MKINMELSMTSIDSVHYHTENTPNLFQNRTYAVSLPVHSGSVFTRLDKVAYSFATFMALAPLAIGTWGASVVGA
jgi:hypothetical protein